MLVNDRTNFPQQNHILLVESVMFDRYILVYKRESLIFFPVCSPNVLVGLEYLFL